MIIKIWCWHLFAKDLFENLMEMFEKHWVYNTGCTLHQPSTSLNYSPHLQLILWNPLVLSNSTQVFFDQYSTVHAPAVLKWASDNIQVTLLTTWTRRVDGKLYKHNHSIWPSSCCDSLSLPWFCLHLISSFKDLSHEEKHNPQILHH